MLELRLRALGLTPTGSDDEETPPESMSRGQPAGRLKRSYTYRLYLGYKWALARP
jgi:hypothetical protein